MDNSELNKYYDLFMMSTMLVLNVVMDLGSADNNNSVVTNSIELYNAIENMQFDMGKTSEMIKKIYIFITKNYQYLKSRDKQLFCVREFKDKIQKIGKQVKVTIIPGIDIDVVYDKLNTDNQNLLWNYVDMLYYSSIKMLSLVKNFSDNEKELLKLMEEKISEDSIREHFYSRNPNSKIYKKSDTFNPYIGIGENGTGYSVDEMTNDMNLANENSADGTYGVSSMVSLLGIDKMLGIDQLADQLKNIDPKDIEEAGSHIKQLLGNNIDEGTSDMINMMLHDITDEFKKDGLSGSGGNAMENIIKLAGNVANKMLPKIDPKKINVDKIWESTQNLANNCTNQYGDKMGGKDNPLSMLTNLMTKQMEQAKKGVHGGKIDPNQHKEMMNEYQNAMKKMGMGNINLNDIQNVLNKDLQKNLNTKKKHNKKH